MYCNPQRVVNTNPSTAISIPITIYFAGFSSYKRRRKGRSRKRTSDSKLEIHYKFEPGIPYKIWIDKSHDINIGDMIEEYDLFKSINNNRPLEIYKEYKDKDNVNDSNELTKPPVIESKHDDDCMDMKYRPSSIRISMIDLNKLYKPVENDVIVIDASISCNGSRLKKRKKYYSYNPYEASIYTSSD